MRKIAICLALLSGGAHAAQWHSAAHSTKLEVLVDSLSIVDIGKYRKAWSLMNYEDAQSLKGDATVVFKSTKQLRYYNCALKQHVSIQTINYSDVGGGGEMMFSQSRKFDPLLLIEVVPDSFGERILDFVCSYSPPAALKPPSKPKKKSPTDSNSAGAPRHSADDLKALSN